MDLKTKIMLAVGVGVGFSLLPVWRSGRNGGQSLFGFLKHHSVFSDNDALWIKKEELEVIRRLAEMKSEDRERLIEEIKSG